MKEVYGGAIIYTMGPDMDLEKQGKLFDFEIEYYDSNIPSSQEKLKQETEKSYSSRTIGGGSGSRYMVDSETHTVLEDKRCYVDVTRLTDNTDSDGCISIYADNVSHSYSSLIITNNGGEYDYSSEEEDNITECFDYSDFPLVVSVSFINENGKQVNSKVRLEKFYDYDITIK